MDSFFEEPRLSPKPSPVIQQIETPSVPEVSLMFQNGNKNNSSNFINKNKQPLQSYNAWKLRNQPNFNQEFDSFLMTTCDGKNKENLGISQQGSVDKSFMKKQVRFQHLETVPQNVSKSLNKEKENRFSAYSNAAETLKRLETINRSNSLKQLETMGINNDKSPTFNGNTSENKYSKPYDLLGGNKSNQNPEHLTSRFSNLSCNSKLETMGSNKDKPPTFNGNTSEIKYSKPYDLLGANKSNQNPEFLTSRFSHLSCNSKSTENKPIEKMYMSNIPLPNRELELSFLEPQNNPCPRQDFYKKAYLVSPVESNQFNHNTDIPYNSTKPLLTENQKRIILELNKEQKTNNETIEQNNSNTETIDNEEKQSKQTNEEKSTTINSSNETINQVETETTTKKLSEPSVQDLLKIIKLQNEQLERLKSTVELLVKQSQEKQNSPSSIEKKVIICKDQQVGTSFAEEFNQIQQQNENVQDKNQKYSVGLMTSFEVKFKPPKNKKGKHKIRNMIPIDSESNYTESLSNSIPENVRRLERQELERERRDLENDRKYLERQRRDFDNQGFENDRKYLERQRRDFENQKRNFFIQRPENKMSDANIPQDRKFKKKTNETEYSLGSEESLIVEDPPASPEHSIHIDMHEYDTDSEDEDSDDECSTDEGWTFYKDILGQVNNLLENSSKPAYKARNPTTTRKNIRSHQNPPKRSTDATIEEIKRNALKRLQCDKYLSSSDDCEVDPNEISFALKQILMKCMEDTDLASVFINGKQNEPPRNDKKKNTDISVTAVKYMQQCNLVANNPQMYGRKSRTDKVPKTRNKMQSNSRNSKVLDITTLKQQPKLL